MDSKGSQMTVTHQNYEKNQERVTTFQRLILYHYSNLLKLATVIIRSDLSLKILRVTDFMMIFQIVEFLPVKFPGFYLQISLRPQQPQLQPLQRPLLRQQRRLPLPH